MKLYSHSHKTRLKSGFALVSTLTVMILLVIIAMGVITLSTLESRSTAQDRYIHIAKANARLALQMAIAELQENLGPDQRISATASVLDTTPETAEITGLSGNSSQHILGVWNSWNHWLNADNDGTTVQDTYTKSRQNRFRKWLISYPDDDPLTNIDAPKSLFTFDETNSVELVTSRQSEDHSNRVLAGLISIKDSSNTAEENGRYAWWVGGQNQKANVKMAEITSTDSSPANVEVEHGNPAKTSLSRIDGFENFETDTETINRLVDYSTIELNNVSKEDLKNKFHDLAVNTDGLLTDVRWGGLKKDLNLLFENSQLPRELTRENRSQAPGPRPLSSDLLSYNPKLDNRAFSSFEMMHEFYRVYRSNESPLDWNSSKPSSRDFLGHDGAGQQHAALKGYRRTPVILKFYSVYSLFSEKDQGNNDEGTSLYNHDLVYSTVVALWNPYNTPLILPDKQFGTYTLPYKILPTDYSGYKNGSPLNGTWIGMNQGNSIYNLGRDFAVKISSGTGEDIRFEPGQIRIFSKKKLNYGSEGTDLDLTPGFDPSAAYGQRIRVYSKKPDDNTRWQVALRLNPRWTFDGTSVYWGGSPGAFGNLIRHQDNNHGIPATLGTMFDWTGPDLDYAKLSPTTSAEVATFEPGIEEAIPFCVVGVSLKTAKKSQYELSSGIDDYRSKNWINGLNAVGLQKLCINYNNSNLRSLQRLDHGYQLHFGPVNGQNDLGQFFSRDITNTLTTLGTGIGSELVNSVPVMELPTAPVTSISGFAGMRLTPGWYELPSYFYSSGDKKEVPGTAMSRFADNTEAYVSGVPGIGLGNSFAHPMIPGDSVYAYHDTSKVWPDSNSNQGYSPSSQTTDSNALSDYWDHAFLVNDGIWDSWFTSSMVNQERPTDSAGSDMKTAITKFYNNNEKLPYRHYSPVSNGKSTEKLVETLTGNEGYKKVAEHLINEDAFNVNSTSLTAWRALLSKLEDKQYSYRDSSGQLKIIEPSDDKITVSRFMTASSNLETTDIYNGTNVQGIGRMWTGVRFLTSDQLDKLAQECVKQVKLRGPFLNMAEFVNRRLSEDNLGLRGALQAAIDYDDDDPDPSSINYRYKSQNDMITDSDHSFAEYPFEKAANGSRFTAAPGYIVQSDLLRPLGNSITVRDDTFIIRTYGDALDKSGNIKARAWCEAIVQRTTKYIDQSNTPETPVSTLDNDGNPNPNQDLTDINKKFGRCFEVRSFRWLHESEL